MRQVPECERPAVSDPTGQGLRQKVGQAHQGREGDLLSGRAARPNSHASRPGERRAIGLSSRPSNSGARSVRSRAAYLEFTITCGSRSPRRERLSPAAPRVGTNDEGVSRAAAARCDLPQLLGMAPVFRHAAPGRANWDAQSPLVYLPSATRRGAAPDTPRRRSCFCRRKSPRPGRRRPNASSARARGWHEILRQSPGGA